MSSGGLVAKIAEVGAPAESGGEAPDVQTARECSLRAPRGTAPPRAILFRS